MIRIACSPEELKKKIDLVAPNWRRWRQIKPVYLDIQSQKCCYCERFIAGSVDQNTGARHSYEQEVEHFRPKGALVVWPIPSRWNTSPPISTANSGGYDWLEFDTWNYVASCETCNKTYKRSYFPVAQGISYAGHPTVGEVVRERSYLIYPLGNVDSNPEWLIEFIGWLPIPHHASARGTHDYWRAKITIEILGLRNETLTTERQNLIVEMAQLWALSSAFPDIKGNWEAYISPSRPHSSCCRSFLNLCRLKSKVACQLALRAASALKKETALQVISKFWPLSVTQGAAD